MKRFRLPIPTVPPDHPCSKHSSNYFSFGKEPGMYPAGGNSLLLLLISAASTEIVNKVSKTNAHRMRTHNAIPRDDTDNYTVVRKRL